ncbi:MAG: DUF5069 domain-containing protein [Verrucomicrobiota bacterium]|jgi:hypothetical protein
MKTNIVDKDLSQEAPNSPRVRFGGFAILGRTVDKCRASLAGKLGEYHYDCPLDNQLFGFKGIDGSQFKSAIASAKSYEDVAAWLQANGTRKTEQEIIAWSAKVEALQLKDCPAIQDHKKEVVQSCEKLGLDFDSATLFEWLEADDEASFHSQLTPK